MPEIVPMATLYRDWVFANGWAEALGLGTTFVLGFAARPLFEASPSPAAVLAGAAVAVVFGTLLEGVLIGIAQGCVLHRALPGLHTREWVIATAAGAGLAWLVGMIPSTAMALLSTPAAGTETPSEPGALAQLGLAAVLGAVTGPILGLAQWLALRRHLAHSGRWLAANSLAWAAGMPLIFLGMDFVPWGGSPAEQALAVYALCGLTGLLVGAIHGRALVRLVEAARETTR